MKKAIVLILALVCSFHSLQAIEWEGRTGLSVSGYWGLHMSAYAGIPVSSRFAVRPGLMLHTVEWDSYRPTDNWRIGLIIPVYASFHFPLCGKTNLRVDAGPYFGVSNECHLGAAAEVGMEIGKIYLGGGFFQNCVGDTDSQFNISVGYKFSL